MPASPTLAPIVFIVVALAVATRFLPNVRTVDAVGLFASGALVGISVMRLLMARRPRR
jgi:hypothetical protein